MSVFIFHISDAFALFCSLVGHSGCCDAISLYLCSDNQPFSHIYCAHLLYIASSDAVAGFTGHPSFVGTFALVTIGLLITPPLPVMSPTLTPHTSLLLHFLSWL